MLIVLSRYRNFPPIVSLHCISYSMTFGSPQVHQILCGYRLDCEDNVLKQSLRSGTLKI